MKARRPIGAWVACATAAAAVAAAAACSTPDPSARVDPGHPPSGADFAPVAAALVHRCGSLDCHGSRYRNMRLYGYGGLRLDPNTPPDLGTAPTPAEVDADYDAVIGLEPILMAQVVSEGGANPERLTLIRKGRGAERHKGGQRMTVGDNMDLCLTSWLAGAVNTDACARVPRENAVRDVDASAPQDAGAADATTD